MSNLKIFWSNQNVYNHVTLAGIYIHIPFCETKCNYCDFYSIVSVDKSLKQRFLNALSREVDLKHGRISEKINTIYFGGGTPSLLSPDAIALVLERIFSLFEVNDEVEITIEINPDDFTLEYAQRLRDETQINRLSFGVQSFIDEELKFLGRRHNAQQAYEAIRIAHKLGFNNVTIDLIYGIPYGGNPMQSMRYNLKEFFSLGLPHLSAYGLTIEENTRFGLWQTQGKLIPVDEETFADLYSYLIVEMEKHGFLHYEISNFAREGFISRHNFSYWTGEQYLGLGPAAHSYDGQKRYWNYPDIHKYFKVLENNDLPEEYEILNEKDKFNEYILTRLRTYLGIDAEFLKENYPDYWQKVEQLVNEYHNNGYLKEENGFFKLTLKGKLIADNIIANLFI